MAHLSSALLQEIQVFQPDSLKQTDTIVRTIPLPAYEARDDNGTTLHRSQAANDADQDDKASLDSGKPMQASLAACHGCCFGFEDERSAWELPRVAAQCQKEARPGYDSLDASEYLDTPSTLKAKVRTLARLVRQSKNCVIYSGAGLSTAAGIGDYASQAQGSLSGAAPPPRSAMLNEICSRGGSTNPVRPNSEAPSAFRSPLCTQPTTAHRVLVSMHAAGFVHRWINQNHDGLPQKAGLPQQAINEIHGAWHAPDNPVVQMSGSVRSDLFADLLDCERDADLAIAVGTSLCGMNADRVVLSTAQRAAKRISGQLGSVVIGLQRTVHDEASTLRIFARCDEVFAALAEELSLNVSPAYPDGQFFSPQVLAGRSESDYCFQDVPYNAFGERSEEVSSRLDVRDDAELVIPSGMHAGAVGVVDGCDREGNIRCRFKLKPKVGKLRAPVMLLLGRWWIQAAVDGAVPLLPIVNKPADDDKSHAAECLRVEMQNYAS